MWHGDVQDEPGRVLSRCNCLSPRTRSSVQHCSASTSQCLPPPRHSLLFVSFTDFIVPFMLYLVLMRQGVRDEQLAKSGGGGGGGGRASSFGDDGDAWLSRGSQHDAHTPSGSAAPGQDAPLLAAGSKSRSGMSLHPSTRSHVSFNSRASKRSFVQRLSEHIADLPLAPETPANEALARGLSGLGSASVGNAGDNGVALGPGDVHEHYAFPQTWHLSSSTRSWIAGTLAVVMAATAVAGIVLSVQTSVTTSWDCTAVG